jgi:hypothetical protein
VGADLLQEALEVSSAAFVFQQASFLDEIGGNAQEAAIVLPEFVTIQVAVLASALNERCQAIAGVLSASTQTRIALAHLSAKDVESRGSCATTGLAFDILPRFSFNSSISKSPLDRLRTY